LLEGQSGVNMFSFEAGAEDCKKKNIYMTINVSMFILSILSDSLTDNRHNTVPKAKTQDSSYTKLVLEKCS
jgi:hypothetical protein